MMMCEESMRRRRDFIKLVFAGALSGATSTLADALGAAKAAPAAAGPPPVPFADGSVLALARQLAKSPFKAPKGALPDPFANLTYEQYVGIRAKPGSALWSDDNVGFALEPLHRGFIFSTPMDINIVENGMARRVRYDRAAFDFGKLQPPADLPDIGFSGFRVLEAVEGQGFQEVAIYQGASFFAPRRAGRTSASRRAACRFTPANRKARNFRCFARSGSKSRSRPPTPWSSTRCSTRRASPGRSASPCAPARRRSSIPN